MKIAELFVNLGLKGAETAVSGIGKVKGALGETKSMSLEAKAGILAALYGFQQMMSQSGQAGTSLTQFASATGLSAKALQQWQWAGRQAGDTFEGVQGSIKGIQNAMTDMTLGKGPIEGLAVLANRVGFSMKEAQDAQNGPFYVMKKLQEFANSGVPTAIAKKMAMSFGIGESTFGAMRLNAFRPEMLNKAPAYSEGQIKSLHTANVAWGNLGQSIEMAFGKFNAKHGVKLVQEITPLVSKVLQLAEALIKIAEKLKVFEAVGKVLEGWGMILDGIAETANGITKDKDGMIVGSAKKLWSGFVGMNEAAAGIGQMGNDAIVNALKSSTFLNPKAPPIQRQAPAGNVTHITMHNQGVKGAEDAASLMGREIQRAHSTNGARKVKK